MGLFYIHHRWLNFYRKGDHLKILVAAFFISMFVFRIGNALLDELGGWVIQLSDKYQISDETTFKLMLVVFFVGMTAIKVTISPAPLHYEPYRLWPVNRLSLALQYLLLSHLKPGNVIWLFTEVVMLVKAAEYGIHVLPMFVGFWLLQHYLNIVLHPFKLMKWTLSIVLAVLSVVIYEGFLGNAWVSPFLQSWTWIICVSFLTLVLAVVSVWKLPAEFLTRNSLSLKVFKFGADLADPLFDLEMKLIWRNKGTRTNLIFGFLAIPLMLYYFSNAGVPAGVYFMAIITTGLVLLQHGIYTMSWEGNYFDMLMTRFTALSFMHFKFRFYCWATSVGLAFSSIALFIDTAHWLPIFAAFCYNLSWNCYVVLFGVMGNKKKLSLGQSIVFKSESMTANVITVSFATIIFPMVLLGILNVFLRGTMAYYGVIAISGAGLLLKDRILKRLATRMEHKKYELSMAFHD